MFIFRVKLSRSTEKSDSRRSTRGIQFLFTQRRVKRAARNHSHLLTIFPIKPGVIFLTGYRSSAPYTVKLEPGIFVIRLDFITGQLVSKFGLVTSVYRKIWTIVVTIDYVEPLVEPNL